MIHASYFYKAQPPPTEREETGLKILGPSVHQRDRVRQAEMEEDGAAC